MLGISWALELLQAVPKVVAAAPQFVKIWDQLVDTFDKDTDQQTLKDAYALAISDAADAHSDLQDLVAANS
jgi:ABC-type transporter Mla subunit MlaD